MPVYLVIWHRILAGVTTNLEEAGSILENVDRLQLIEWLDRAQNEADFWEWKFGRLYGALSDWHRYARHCKGRSKKELAERKPSMFDPPKEVLQAKDPIAKILEMHRLPSKEDECVED